MYKNTIKRIANIKLERQTPEKRSRKASSKADEANFYAERKRQEKLARQSRQKPQKPKKAMDATDSTIEEIQVVEEIPPKLTIPPVIDDASSDDEDILNPNIYGADSQYDPQYITQPSQPSQPAYNVGAITSREITRPVDAPKPKSCDPKLSVRYDTRLRFVEYLKPFKCLYDKRSPSYKKLDIRKVAMKTLAKRMCFTGPKSEKHVRNLLDNVKKIAEKGPRTSPSGSGALQTTVRRAELEFYRAASYLKQCSND